MKHLLQATILYLLSLCSLYSASCEILIIGAERSGTGYMSTLLRRSGYDVGHQGYGVDGSVSWPMVVNQYQPWIVNTKCKDRFKRVFHQVRHPLKVIQSIVLNFSDDMETDTWVFKRKCIPDMDPLASPIVQAAQYWYYWNLMAEKKSEWRYRVEDLPLMVDEFERRSGLKISRSALEKLPKNYQTIVPIEKELTWEDLEAELPEDLYVNIFNMSRRYGYRTLTS